MCAWRRNEKKDRNFHASNWLFARTTHVDLAPKILHAGSCLGNSYTFQVSEKAAQGSRSCGGVENRPLPLTRPMAYTTACTTVQTVILILLFDYLYVNIFETI